MKSGIVLLLLVGTIAYTNAIDCEVCVGVLTKFLAYAGDDVSDVATSENALIEFCGSVLSKEERFCYYIGALETSATRIISSVTRQLSYGKPPEKICRELGKKDSQICELQYEKQIDWTSIDLGKLRVKELKKILNDWGESCRGCAEKRDFIEKIDQLKPHHVEL